MANCDLCRVLHDKLPFRITTKKQANPLHASEIFLVFNFRITNPESDMFAMHNTEDLLMAKIPLDKMKRTEIHDVMKKYGFTHVHVPPKDETDDDLDDFAEATKGDL
ncbi:unnamed protein product [Amoebophrya sp. A120]|nr:unnamed protein product [Amoebophrya sp. A120]|eukprot:GSA120T00008685001.1